MPNCGKDVMSSLPCLGMGNSTRCRSCLTVHCGPLGLTGVAGDGSCLFGILELLLFFCCFSFVLSFPLSSSFDVLHGCFRTFLASPCLANFLQIILKHSRQILYVLNKFCYRLLFLPSTVNQVITVLTLKYWSFELLLPLPVSSAS